MSLNAELNGFLNAYSKVDQIRTNRSKSKYYEAMSGSKNNTPANPNSAASQWINQQAGPAPPNTAPNGGTSSGGALGRAASWVGNTLGLTSPGASGGGGGGAVPMNGVPLAPMDPDAGVPSGQSDAVPGDDNVAPEQVASDNYADGGEVRRERDEPPITLPPPVAPAGNGAVPVGDQTRTAAYDPETEGPPAAPAPAVPQQGAPAAQAAPPAGGGAVPVNGAPPQAPSANTGANTGANNGLNPQGSDAGSTNSVTSDLDAALHGGMRFAQNTFHLNDPNDPHHGGGKQALFSGVGAADHPVVKAIDDKVNKDLKYDPQLYAVRRLEATYRWYSMNGDTKSADKAAFELLQYSAGIASQWGARAVDQYKAGDMQGAIKSVQEGYNHVPDGQHMEVQGDKATITDKRTGKVVNQFQFKPEQVFQAAMGLDSRSLYWQQLAERVQQSRAPVNRRSPEQTDLDKARTDLIRARTAKLKAGPAPKGGGGVSDNTKALIDAINGEGAGAPPPKGEPPHTDAGGKPLTDEPSEEPGADREAAMPPSGEEETEEEGTGSDAGGKDPTLTPSGNTPTPAEIAAGAKPTVRQKDGTISTEKTIGVEMDGKHYVIPTIIGGKSMTPDAAIAAFKRGDVQPLGTFDSEAEATKFAEQRSRDLDAAFGGNGTLHKGPSSPAAGQLDNGHPGYEEHDPDKVPDLKIGHDGEKYVSGSSTRGAEPFDEEKPGPNPYRKYEAAAAKLSNKEGGAAVRQMLQRKIADYDKQAGGWDKRKTAHEKAEGKRVDTENKAGEATLQKSMRVYDQQPKPGELSRMQTHVDKAFDEAVTTAKRGGKAFAADADPKEIEAAEKSSKDQFTNSIFGDPDTDPKKFKAVALSLMTSNPNMTADKAIRLTQQLSTIDPNDATKRVYKPTGRDVTASKNVVLAPTEDGPHKFAPVHVRPEAYDDLRDIVKKRLGLAATRGKQAATDAVVAAEGNGSQAVVDKAKKLAGRAADAVIDKMTSVAKPAGATLLDDVKDIGGALGRARDYARRAVGAIPAGSGEATQRAIDNYKRP